MSYLTGFYSPRQAQKEATDSEHSCVAILWGGSLTPGNAFVCAWCRSDRFGADSSADPFGGDSSADPFGGHSSAIQDRFKNEG